MPADHKKYKNAEYYISRLTYLPADYLAMLRELKNKMTSRRLLSFTFRELCAQLQLDDADLKDADFCERSGRIYAGVSRLVEKFGLKLIPAVMPAAMEPDAVIFLTGRPNLNNDDDISHVQGIIKLKRQLTQRDMIYVQRMQEKLANYNIMLRVFEGLSLIKTPRLNPQQMSVIDAELNERSLPVEGAKFLRTCYSFYSQHPLPKVSFSDKKLCLKRMDKEEHNQAVCRILIKTAGAGECALLLDPDYPLHQEMLQMLQSRAAGHSPGNLQLTAMNAFAGEVIADQIHDADKAAHDELAAHPDGLPPAERQRLINLICRNLKADSSLLPFQLQLIERLLPQQAGGLVLMPSFHDLSFTLNQTSHPQLQHSLSVVTSSRRDKKLYPFFILDLKVPDLTALDQTENEVDLRPLGENGSSMDGNFDPACCDIFATPFNTPPELPRENAAAFGIYVGALVCFYLLQRCFIRGYDAQCADLFRIINNHFVTRDFKPSSGLLLSCGLFYYLYHHHFTRPAAAVPEIVIASLLASPALLALFAQRILRRHNLYLSTMSEPELEVVLMYILHIIKNAHFVRGERNINLHHAKTRRAFLKKIGAFCLEKESRRGRPLFLQFTPADMPEEEFYFDAVDDRKFFSGGPFNAFMGLIPNILIKSFIFDQVAAQSDFEIIRLSDYDDPQFSYAALMQELATREPIITYLSLTEQLLPAHIFAALSSQETFTPQLREAFPLNSSIATAQLLHRFALDSDQFDIKVLRFILSKAGLIAVPQLPSAGIQKLMKSWKYMRFIKRPDPGENMSDKQLELLISRLPRVQTAVHFLLSVCNNYMPAAIYKAVLRACQTDVDCGFGDGQRELIDSYIRVFYSLVQNSCTLKPENLPNYYFGVCSFGQDSSRKLIIELCSIYLQLIDNYAGPELVQTVRYNMEELTRRMKFDIPGLQSSRPGKAGAKGKGKGKKKRSFAAEAVTAARLAQQQKKSPAEYLNLQLIASKQQESSEILSVIGKIRDANEEQPWVEEDELLPAENAADTAAGQAADADAAARGENEGRDEVPGPGEQLAALLDVQALKLLSALKAQQSEVMDLREFEGLCLSADFMSSSVAIEMLNDFSFEHFDEPFFEAVPEENAVYISTHLITEIMPD